MFCASHSPATQGYFATAVLPLDAEAVWRGGTGADALARAAVEVLVDSGAECVGRRVLCSKDGSLNGAHIHLRLSREPGAVSLPARHEGDHSIVELVVLV